MLSPNYLLDVASKNPYMAKLYLSYICRTSRLNHENDHFTYLAEQGRSVVEYIKITHDWFEYYSPCHVYTMNGCSVKCNIALLMYRLTKHGALTTASLSNIFLISS